MKLCIYFNFKNPDPLDLGDICGPYGPFPFLAAF